MKAVPFLLLLLTLAGAAAAAPDTGGIEYDPRLGAAVPADVLLRDEAGAPVPPGCRPCWRSATSGAPTYAASCATMR